MLPRVFQPRRSVLICPRRRKPTGTVINPKIAKYRATLVAGPRRRANRMISAAVHESEAGTKRQSVGISEFGLLLGLQLSRAVNAGRGGG